MARRKKQNEDDSQESQNINNDADDTFGLPEVEYEPINRDEPVAETPVEDEPEPEPEPVAETSEYVQQEHHYNTANEYEENRYEEDVPEEEANDEYVSPYAAQDDERAAIWPKVLLIIFLVVVAGGAIYYFAVYSPKEKAAQEKIAKEAKAKKDAAAALLAKQKAEELKRQEAEKRTADSLAAIPKIGTIEVLSGRTGQYYIVAASAIDDDLLMDYANKLIKGGTQVKIIPPFGKAKVYRLAVDVKENATDAQATADGMKGGNFGDQLWVIKY